MLGVAAASIVGLATICFSIGMAHIFYRSKRKRWQTVLAWGLCTLVIVVLGELLRPAVGNRSGQFSGFLAVFVYLCLFDVPVKQRLFTYFFVDTSMYATAVLARYTVLLVHGFFPGFDPKAPFVVLYFVLTAACVFVFFRFLRDPMVTRLAQFGAHMGSLTAFACVGYVLLLVLFDAWAIRQSVPPMEWLALVLYMGLLGCGYYLSFFTMTAVRDAAVAQAQVRELTAQVRQSERYYATLTGHIQDIRRMQHDSRHHLRVLDGYAREGAYAQLRAYLATLIQQVPDTGAGLLRQPHRQHPAGLLQGTGQGRRDPVPVRRPDPGGTGLLPGGPVRRAGQRPAKRPGRLPAAGPVIGAVYLPAGPDGGEQPDPGTEEQLRRPGGGGEDGLLSRKEEPGHGLGLGSIRRVAEQYHGYCSVTRTAEEFVLRVVLGAAG